MLASLDIAIALIVVLLTVSLLVMLLTQMISAFLALRGRNLRNGLIILISSVDPRAKDHARDIVEEVLHHPLISDSTVANALARVVREVIPAGGRRSLLAWAWSLVGTLRLRNLVRAWGLASHVRLEELVGALQLLSAPGSGLDEDTREAMKRLAQQAQRQMESPLGTVTKQAAAIVEKMPHGGLPQGAVLQVDEVLERVQGAADEAFGTNIKSWFDSTMDRVAQRFRVQMRIWTMLFGVVIAFALHLDTLQLLNRFRADAQLRANLVGLAGPLQQRAAAILQDQKSSPGAAVPGETPAAPTGLVPRVYGRALTEARVKKAEDELAEVRGALATTKTNVLVNREAQLTAEIATLRGNTSGPEFKSRQAAEAWIRAELPPGNDRDAFLVRYNATVDKLLSDSEGDRLMDEAATLVGSLDDAGFSLVPHPYHRLDYVPFLPFFDARHLLGVLLTAGLLGLGAPFWFNALKSLTSLRPVSAAKEQEKGKDSQDRKANA